MFRLFASAEDVVAVGCEDESVDMVRYVAFFNVKKNERDLE